MFHLHQKQNNKYSSNLFLLLLLAGFIFPISTVRAATNCVCMSAGGDCQSITDVAAGGCSAEACAKMFGKDFTSPNVDVGGDAQAACSKNHEAYIAASDTSSSGTKTKKAVTPTLNVPIPGLKFTDAISGTCSSGSGQCIKTNFLAEYINAIYAWMIGAGITIAIVMVMIGGLQYTLSAGGSDVGKAKERIAHAVSGIILLVCVYLILNVINPQLTQLKMIELQNVPLYDIDSGNEEG